MAASPRLSFSGYKFSEALYRNKDAVKALVMVLGGYNTYITVTGGFDWKALAISLGVAVGALGVKLISDAVDFFFTEVTLE
jgi:hypothetical protein